MSFKLKRKKTEAPVQKLNFQDLVADSRLVEDTRIQLDQLSHTLSKTEKVANVENKNNLLGKPSALAKMISDIKPASINKELVL